MKQVCAREKILDDDQTAVDQRRVRKATRGHDSAKRVVLFPMTILLQFDADHFARARASSIFSEKIRAMSRVKRPK